MASLDSKKIKRNSMKRVKTFLVVTLIELIVAPFLAYLMHQFFSKLMINEFENMFILDFNFLNAYTAFFTNAGVRVWFLVLQAAYLITFVYVILTVHQSLSTVNTIKITDYIQIPVPVGNGQYGSERFLTEDEIEELFDIAVIKNGKEKLDTGGVPVAFKKERTRDLIFYLSKDIHTIVLGATGMGKTRRVLIQMTLLQMFAGENVTATDVKGEVYYITSPFAKALGYKINALDFRNLLKTDNYSFVKTILDCIDNKDIDGAMSKTWDLVSVFVGEPKGTDPIWYHGETATIATAIIIVLMDAPKECRNMTNIYAFLGYMSEVLDEYGNTGMSLYVNSLPEEHPAKLLYLQSKSAPPRTRGSFITSALGTLRLFTLPSVQQMSKRDSFDLYETENQKTITYLIIPDEIKTLYPLITIFIQQRYMADVDIANRNGNRLPNRMFLNLEEAGNIPKIPVLPNITSAGRSRGVIATLVLQDYTQLGKYGKEDSQTIINNCRLKILINSNDPKTKKDLSESLGNYTVEVPSTGSSVNENKGLQNQGTYSSNSSMAKRPLLFPEEIGRIKAPHALIKLESEFPAITELPDLSRYRLNKILGLGDEKYNNKLFQRREEERPIKQSKGNVPLWGIWNTYYKNVNPALMNNDDLQNALEKVTDSISFLD